MNIRSLFLLLSLAAVAWIATVSLTNTAKAVMHEGMVAASNMTENGNATTTTTAEEGDEGIFLEGLF